MQEDFDQIDYRVKKLQAEEAREAAAALQQAKLKALQDTLGKYGNFRYYVDWDDLLDPNNQNWTDYTYKVPAFMATATESGTRHGRVGGGTPVYMLIKQIRDAENIDDVKKQLEIWNSYKPLEDVPNNGKSYIRYFIPGFGMHSTTPSVGSRPVQTTAGGTGGAQGVVTVGGAQGAQAGVQAGAEVARSGTQGSNNGSGGTQGAKAGNGILASPGVAKGGTKTIGYDPYDPNPGNVSLAYAMRNAPEQERRAALIDKWNRENRSSSTYASPGISTGGTYATGESIKDANGNVLTNPGGDWEYQYALKNPQYGLGMMGKMSDAQKNYLQTVSDNMGYKYNFTGATRFV